MTRLFNDFFKNEKSPGFVLFFSAVISMLLANFGSRPGYVDFWQIEFGSLSVTEWINDGLMTVFFLSVGLELKQELRVGNLSNRSDAMMPVVAALGGMLIPAGLHLLMNKGTISQAGAGIPMATDIAFSLAVLSILGNRVPVSLKVFLTALAVIDDLGAIIVIATFYTSTINWVYLAMSLSLFGILFLLNRFKVLSMLVYCVGGVVMWYLMMQSGIHPTISGVLLAFAIPFREDETRSPSHRILRFLHLPVAFIILPLFALANTCIVFPDQWTNGLFDWNSIGIMSGLVIGKPFGIFLFCYGSAFFGLTQLRKDLNWTQIIGAGCLAGIGFTMSIFITLLAFHDQRLVDQSKIAIIVSSATAIFIGSIVLSFSARRIKKAV